MVGTLDPVCFFANVSEMVGTVDPVCFFANISETTLCRACNREGNYRTNKKGCRRIKGAHTVRGV